MQLDPRNFTQFFPQKEGIFDTLTGTNFVLIIIRILSISIKIVVVVVAAASTYGILFLLGFSLLATGT